MTDTERTARYIGAAQAVGLKPPHLVDLKLGRSVGALAEYLSRSYDGRPSYFSAKELCTAKYPEIFGSFYIIPPIKWWPRVLLLRWFADQLRGRVPAYVAHLYRPEPYNNRVGSVSTNHVFCCAIDLDFSSDEQFMDAVRVCERVYHSPLNMRIGFGVGISSRRLHVDLWTPGAKQPRWWSYDKRYKGPRR